MLGCRKRAIDAARRVGVGPEAVRDAELELAKVTEPRVPWWGKLCTATRKPALTGPPPWLAPAGAPSASAAGPAPAAPEPAPTLADQ